VGLLVTSRGTLREGPLEREERAHEHSCLRAIEGSAFFELVRSTAVVEVYCDQETWDLLGYEGPSFAKGGYLHRGFNDLDWLPEPEKPAMGGYAYFADEEFLPDPEDERA
jgi:hypothetical protein